MKRSLNALFVVLAFSASLLGQETQPLGSNYQRKEDIVYGRIEGAALVMDVFAPKSNGNGCGVIAVISGGWVSSKANVIPMFEKWFVEPLTERGYTVFAVMHACQPHYTINEIVPMIRRSVRYIRIHSDEYAISRDKLGIAGGSAGGHLSLMISTEEEAGNAMAADPVDREVCRVKAAVVFFPPTDFLNYGKAGQVQMGTDELKFLRAPFDFREMSKTSFALERVTPERAMEIGKEISPAQHVSGKSAPVLLIHGDADALVPIQQSRLYKEKMEAAGATVKLIERPGQGHGWRDVAPDLNEMGNWFDRWVAGKGAPATTPATAP